MKALYSKAPIPPPEKSGGGIGALPGAIFGVENRKPTGYHKRTKWSPHAGASLRFRFPAQDSAIRAELKTL